MSGPVAIIGAGGFVGARLVESMVLDGHTEIRALVRAYRSFAGLCRFGPSVEMTLANAEDPASLTETLRGCSTAVNLTTGNPAGIGRSTKAIYEACLAAGVQRLVHLSSAVVFGEVASSSVHDDSPPVRRHWMPYARAKGAAENWLRERMPSSGCQLAVLRPGIVWGVRSSHTLNMIQALADKSAYVVDGGKGIFNGIYVDNLVACIQACCTHSSDITGFYNVADQELVTWRGFYAAFAEHVGYDMNQVATVPGDSFPWSTAALLDWAQALPVLSGLSHRLKSKLPDAVKAKIKSALAGRYNYERIAGTYVASPRVDRELWHLQQTKHKLPTEKFAHHFGFSAPVTFEEGVRKTLAWLRSIGYINREPAFAESETTTQ